MPKVNVQIFATHFRAGRGDDDLAIRFEHKVHSRLPYDVGSRRFIRGDSRGEDKSAGGIIIPDTAKEKPSQGEIVAVGPGGRDENGKLIPIDLKTGDTVLFGKWSGTEVKIEGDEFVILREDDVLAIVG